MTEAEWLACSDPTLMLESLRGRLTERKLRLIGCACCRACWDQLTLPENRATVEVAERMADGLASGEEIRNGLRTAAFARDLATGYDSSIPARYQDRTTWLISLSVYALVLPRDYVGVSDFLAYLHEQVDETLQSLSEIGVPTCSRLQQTLFLRDLVGNPYRPVDFCQKWRTTTALALAQRIYESRDFGALPILADALEEAGSDSDEMLSHGRGSGPHVQGCWVVDLVLGKE